MVISFVMAVGRYTYIRDAVDSIRKQLGEWELIIYNNKDRKFRIPDERVTVVETPNWSPAKCYNDARKRAKSDYIAIATDDDIWFPERAIITEYHLNNGADYFAGSCIEFDKNNYKKWIKIKKYNLRWQREVANQISLPFVGYNKHKVPDFNEELKVTYDYLFNLECGIRGLNILTSIMPLGMKRIWKGSLYESTSKDDYEKELAKIRIMLNDERIRA